MTLAFGAGLDATVPKQPRGKLRKSFGSAIKRSGSGDGFSYRYSPSSYWTDTAENASLRMAIHTFLG